MQVIYRITSIPSTNPSPIHQDNKDLLNEICLDHFLMAFSDIRPRITFLADYCDCQKMIKNLCFSYDYDFQIITSESGINDTMVKSYELASEMEDYVLFQECDYFYKDVCGQTFLSALKYLGLVSPYDHPNFYAQRFRDIHSSQCEIALINNHHFRTVERNTMTWGCHSKLVKDNLDTLIYHGYLDGKVWEDLRNKGYKLWVPIPSLATHMVKDFMAPSVEWSLV